MTDPIPSNDNLSIVKGYTKSPLFLVRGGLHFLFAVFYAGFMISLFSLSKDFVMITSGTSSNVRTVRTAETVQSIGIVSSVFSTIPILLIALGYILIWAKSRSAAPSSDPSSGVTILNVFGILRMIAAVITSVVLLLYSVVMIVVMISEKNRTTTSSTKRTNGAVSVESGVIWISIFLAFAALAILFSAIANKKYLTTVKKSLNLSEQRYRKAKTSGVLFLTASVLYLPCIVFGVYMLSNYARLPFIIGETQGDSSGNVAWLLAMKGGALFTFLFLMMLTVLAIYLVSALISFGYFKYIERIQTPPAQPGYVPAGQPPYPYAYPSSPDGANPPQPSVYDPNQQR